MDFTKLEWRVVLKFWFEEATPEQWYRKDLEFDKQIGERFLPVMERAARGELYRWRDALEGRVAEIIVLDQFSRNVYRGTAKAFAQDPIALTLAQEATRDPGHTQLADTKKSFLYMPFMHSESLAIHERAVELFSQPGLESGLDFEIRHKKILERFGRFPHRNQILGRTSTPEEIEFLKQPGSSF